MNLIKNTAVVSTLWTLHGYKTAITRSKISDGIMLSCSDYISLDSLRINEVVIAHKSTSFTPLTELGLEPTLNEVCYIFSSLLYSNAQWVQIYNSQASVGFSCSPVSGVFQKHLVAYFPLYV